METEFQGDLPLLVDIIRIANKVEGWEELIPQTYQLMFKMIRLADFVGVDPILEVAANYLGTHPSRINNSNGIHAVRMRVRNAYRMVQKIAKFQVDKIGHTCMVCKQTVIPPPSLFSQPFAMPCCKAVIHPSCRQNWAMCPFCSIPYVPLPCCVCQTNIDPGPVFLDYWLMPGKCKTPCCEADMHQECVGHLPWCAAAFNGRVAVCPVCGVPLTHEGELYKEMWGATDYIFLRRHLREMEEWKRTAAETIPVKPLPAPLTPEWWQEKCDVSTLSYQVKPGAISPWMRIPQKEDWTGSK